MSEVPSIAGILFLLFLWHESQSLPFIITPGYKLLLILCYALALLIYFCCVTLAKPRKNIKREYNTFFGLMFIIALVVYIVIIPVSALFSDLLPGEISTARYMIDSISCHHGNKISYTNIEAYNNETKLSLNYPIALCNSNPELEMLEGQDVLFVKKHTYLFDFYPEIRYNRNLDLCDLSK